MNMNEHFPPGRGCDEFVHRAGTGGTLEIRFMRNWCWFLTFLNLQPIVFRRVSVSHKQRREHRARGSREAWSPRLAGFQHVSSRRGFTSIWLSLHCFRAAQRHIVRAVKSSGGSKWASVSGHGSYKGANSWVGGKQSPPPSLGGF